MSEPTTEEYLARAEFAGRMLGHKLRGEHGSLAIGMVEAIKTHRIEEWMIVMDAIGEPDAAMSRAGSQADGGAG